MQATATAPSSDQQMASSSNAATDQYPPLPMQYARLYTDENVAARSDQLAPPPTLDGHYTMFGEPCSTTEPILQSLESLGITQLYRPGGDRRVELKRLLYSAIAAYLDLIEILVRCPEAQERQRKLEDIRLFFINMHHLINEYRPIQARETVELMLELQKSDREEIDGRFRKHTQVVYEMLDKATQALPTSDQLHLPAQLVDSIRREGVDVLDSK